VKKGGKGRKVAGGNGGDGRGKGGTIMEAEGRTKERREGFILVHGKCEISQPIPPKPLDQFGCRFKYITMFAQGVDVQNLIKIDSVVAARVFCGFVC